MMNRILTAQTKHLGFADKFSTFAVLGMVVAIAMPLVSAVIYPTYRHFVSPVSAEWSRLIELPFVLCETLIIYWALRRGMNSTIMWQRLPKDIKIASVVLLIGIFASSLFISSYPYQSMTLSLINIMHLLFSFAVFHLIKTSSSRDPSELNAFFGVGLILLALVTAWKFVLPPPLSEIPGGVIEWGNALPGFISVRHFGSWTGALTAAFMAILLYRNDRDPLSLVHFFYFVAAAMTIWSGTRAAVLALALTAIILVCMQRKLPSFRAVSILAMLTGAAMTAAWILIPYNNPDFFLYYYADIGSGGADQLASGRLTLWTASLEKWQESIFLGWGSGSTFWEVHVLNWSHTQPHNAVVQFLITWGLIGASGALWLLTRAIVAVHKITILQPELQPVLAILYTSLLMSLLEGMLHYPRFIMLIMIMFAIILANKDNKDAQGSGLDALRENG